MNYILNQISDTTAKNINDGWFEQLSDIDGDLSYLASSVDRMVDWCEKVLAAGENHLWEICEEGDTFPRAIVEIADARKSKDPSLKFLNIYLEPNLILDYKEEVLKEDIEAAIDILAYAMIASLSLAEDKGTRKLKIFGRTSEMLNLFDSLLLTAPDEYNLKRQGKWMIIECR